MVNSNYPMPTNFVWKTPYVSMPSPFSNDEVIRNHAMR